MQPLNSVIQIVDCFENHLGDYFSDDAPMNFKQILALDETECFPSQQIKHIQDWGYMDYLVPQALGGKLQSLMEVYFLGKALARRDLTTAIALGQTLLGALPVWIAGTREQKEYLADHIRAGNLGCLALTEEEHGSDLTANEMMAVPHQDGWQLSGKKWCINNATLGDTATVLCRTHPAGGIRGFSLFLVDKKQITAGIQALPKLPTHGVRGLDISGFIFNNVYLQQHALVGEKNHGLEITYKTLQVSRTLCACFSLGAADTALRLALDYTLKRYLYQRAVFDIPVVKQRLVESYLCLLMAECTALAITRACSAIPERMSLLSAAAKFLIPKIAEHIIEESALVIGARSYLRTAEWATLQKIRRDNQVIGLFDGSSEVNLFIISGNLLPQARNRGEHKAIQPVLMQIFNFNEGIPDFTGEHLRSFNHGQDEIIAGIMQLESEELDSVIKVIRAELTNLDKQVLEMHEQVIFDQSGLEEFRLAETYCWLLAASCTIQFWFYNRDYLPAELKKIEWLELAMQIILRKINRNSGRMHHKANNNMADYLKDQYEQKKMFSVFPTSIGS